MTEEEFWGRKDIPVPKLSNEEDIAYAAGLIDGEGCIGMYLNTHNGNYQLRITVEMVDRAGLDLLHKLFGGKFYFKEAKIPRRARHTWMVFNNEAKIALEYLQPYLRIKYKQAAAALTCDWYSFIGKPLTDEEQFIRRAAWGAIHEMNKRGYYGPEGN